MYETSSHNRVNSCGNLKNNHHTVILPTLGSPPKVLRVPLGLKSKKTPVLRNSH